MAPKESLDDDAHTVVKERMLTKKRLRKPMAEVQKLKPRLGNSTPPEGVMTHMELIECGKIVNIYARHEAAPYAFNYRGKIRWRFGKHLVAMKNTDGI